MKEVSCFSFVEFNVKILDLFFFFFWSYRITGFNLESTNTKFWLPCPSNTHGTRLHVCHSCFLFVCLFLFIFNEGTRLGHTSYRNLRKIIIIIINLKNFILICCVLRAELENQKANPKTPNLIIFSHSISLLLSLSLSWGYWWKQRETVGYRQKQRAMAARATAEVSSLSLSLSGSLSLSLCHSIAQSLPIFLAWVHKLHS